MKKLSLILIFVMFISSNLVFSQSEETEIDLNPEEPCDVYPKMKDGKFSSLKACGQADIKGKVTKSKERRAKKKAKMRAQSAIAYFFSTRISSEDTSDSITKELAKEEDGEESYSLENVEAQTESIKTNADAMIKGAVTLDSFCEDDYCEVWIGMNLKTMKAADSAKYNVEKDQAAEERESDKKKGVSSSNSGTSSKSKTKRRKRKNADEF
jgi:hypothetical protein